MKRSSLVLGSGLTLAALALAAAACGDPLNDYRDCVRLEKARCALREKCDPTFDLETCNAYYREFCRTREIDGELGKSATKEQVDACVAVIEGLDCALLDSALDEGIDETDLLEECTFAHPKDEPDAGDAG
jgi:hypothetical protein